MARRILLYSHDTVGLGHIRRVLAIGRTLALENPRDTVLILTGSTIVDSMHLPPNVDTIKLPAIRKVENSLYAARRLDLDRDQIIRLRAEIIRQTLQHFDPHLFIVDKAPIGVHGELEPALEWNRERERPARVILSLRDILDDPDEVISSWNRERIPDAIRRYYDRILVWGQPDVYDLVREYRLPEDIAQKLEYCGYITTEVAPAARVTNGDRGYKKLVVATVGGGEDGFHLLDHFVQSLTYTTQRFASVLLMGPDLADDRKAKLRERISEVSRPVFAVEFSRHVERLISAADLVVSMAGYNTICEVVSRGRRAIVVPRTSPRREQLRRAERFDALGHLRMIHPDELTPRGLASAIEAELDDRGRRPRHRLDFGGLRRAMRILDAETPGTLAVQGEA